MTFFVVWEPSIRRLRLVKTGVPQPVKQLREILRLPPSIGQIFSVSGQKYNYIKEILQDVQG